MLPRSIFVLALLLSSIVPAKAAGDTGAGDGPLKLLYTVSKTYDPLAWLHGGDRFDSDTAIFVQEGNRQRLLVAEFAATADPALSFDGEKVLFTGKSRAQDPWQVWEISLSEEKPRRVTKGNEDCIRPFYLPSDRIVYARKIGGRFVIETSDLTGSKILPLTYIISNALPTDVLRDGRILFESGYPLGADGTPEIYTVYSDGSGVESYRCDHGAARHGGRQAGSGDVIFATSHGLARFTSARATALAIDAANGDYSGGFTEIRAGEWIVSWRMSASQNFRLMHWTEGERKLEPLVGQPDSNLIEPTVIAPHPAPNRHPSGLHDWANANLLCLNSYTSKYQFGPGSIHSVRIYTRDVGASPKLLGTAPVERDGSFFVQVPNDQPLQIELIDAAGKILKREAGFFWMRRGEQRGCVGCHAGPETAPENAVPVILLKSTTPSDLTGRPAASAGGR